MYVIAPLDKIAAEVVQKYQTPPARGQEKARPSAQEQEAIKILKRDPQLRTEFINNIAAPIANKMFE